MFHIHNMNCMHTEIIINARGQALSEEDGNRPGTGEPVILFHVIVEQRGMTALQDVA